MVECRAAALGAALLVVAERFWWLQRRGGGHPPSVTPGALGGGWSCAMSHGLCCLRPRIISRPTWAAHLRQHGVSSAGTFTEWIGEVGLRFGPVLGVPAPRDWRRRAVQQRPAGGACRGPASVAAAGLRALYALVNPQFRRKFSSRRRCETTFLSDFVQAHRAPMHASEHIRD